MSDAEDRASSQDIDYSSSSTRNSRGKRIFANLIYKSTPGSKRVETKSETSPKLPCVEKRDYVESWILSSVGNFLSCRASVSGCFIRDCKGKKREAESPINDGSWKRSKSEKETRKKSKFEIYEDFNDYAKIEKSSIENRAILERDRDVSVIEVENSRFSEMGALSSTLNQSAVSREPPCVKMRKTKVPTDSEASKRTTGHVRRTPDVSKILRSNEMKTASPGETRDRKKGEEIDERNVRSASKMSDLSRIFGEISNVRENFEARKEHYETSFHEDSSPLRWNGYENAFDGTQKKENLTFADRRGIYLENHRRRELEGRLESPESPLRWTGYEIRDSPKTRKSLPLSSPITARERFLRSSSTDEPGEHVIADDQSSMSSPVRWNGFHRQIRDLPAKPETPILSSPMIDDEIIINSSTNSESKNDSISDNPSPAKSLSIFRARGARALNVRCPETPSSLKKCESMDFSNYDQSNSLKVIDSAGPSGNNCPGRRNARPIRLERIFDSETPRADTSGPSSLPEVVLEAERVRVESSSARLPEDEAKIDSENDSENDLTIADEIENILSQNPSVSKSPEYPCLSELEVVQEKVSARSHERSDECDSDETFCSVGNPVCHTQVQDVLSGKKTEIISQESSNSRDLSRGKSNLISQASSPLKNNEEPTIRVLPNFVAKGTTKRTKKAKKGSLAAKLQSLVASRVSNLQLWRYQKSRAEFNDSRTQFVKLTIESRETRYGRHFLNAIIIEDSHDLLKNLTPRDDENTNDEKALTLIIVPEINGGIKIRDNDILDIYPPWEVMDRSRRILNVIYFDVTRRNGETKVSHKKRRSIDNESVVENFDCPCLRRGAIDDSCSVKFTDKKPTAIAAVFSENLC